MPIRLVHRPPSSVIRYSIINLLALWWFSTQSEVQSSILALKREQQACCTSSMVLTSVADARPVIIASGRWSSDDATMVPINLTGHS